jgi:metal-sulfur cluster biosynthetic enzyme
MKQTEKEVKRAVIKLLQGTNLQEKSVILFFLNKMKYMTNQDNKIGRKRVIDALKRVHDPEIPVNIYDLGLIYELKIDDQAVVYIRMTLTTPNCPIAEDMPGQWFTNEVKAWKELRM